MFSGVVQDQLKKINSGFARPTGYPKTQIKKIGVIGAGLMGHGISLVSSLNGVEVILLDKTEELAKNGLLKINKILKNKIDHKEISPNKVKETLKSTAEDSLKDENNLETQPNKKIEISKNEDNMSSTKL